MPQHCFTTTLLQWFKQHARELPFRYTTSIYEIWLSEIILQQTQIKQGLPYYHRFIKRFPTIFDLSSADEQEVLKLWQGLGYYSRARNLHHCAKEVVGKYKGQFPSEYKALIALKGIGDYTAKAILSFGFRKPYAVVDGNVFRVLTRYFGIHTPIDSTKGKQQITAIADKLLCKTAPDIYNHAIMDFGAMVCTSKNPLCLVCPLQQKCVAFLQQKVYDYPQKQQTIIKRKRHFYYLLPHSDDYIWLIKREHKDIWQHLFEPPKIESDQPLTKNALSQRLHMATKQLQRLHSIKHALTHQQITLQFFKIMDDSYQLPTYFNAHTISQSELNSYPMPQPIAQFLTNGYRSP